MAIKLKEKENVSRDSHIGILNCSKTNYLKIAAYVWNICYYASFYNAWITSLGSLSLNKYVQTSELLLTDCGLLQVW
jgi:hypothetical protein